MDGRRLPWAKDVLLFGLLRVFTGPLLLAVVEKGGKAPVLSPALPPAARLFEPVVSERAVQPMSGSPGSYRLQGGPYAAGCRCRLDASGLLDHYEWNQPGVGQWLVERQPGH